MYTVKQLFKSTLFAALAITAVSCSKDKGSDSANTIDQPYALGIGITNGTTTTNYVVQTDNLMSGKISAVNNGLLQIGYRDYAYGASTFFAIGGLASVDVNTITLDGTGALTQKTGLILPGENNDMINVDENTLLGVSFPASPTVAATGKFYTINIASNAIDKSGEVPVSNLFSKDWIFHTGMQINGDKLFQSFYPLDATTYDTQYTDTNYVAVYSYPGFVLEKVIKDTRTGPAGAFNTRSGMVKTENGDIYTISNTNIENGYSQSTKPAGILRIKSGTTEFDPGYFFNTDTAPNGGKIAHAKYVGDGLVFVSISTKAPSVRWADDNLRLAIVNLNTNTITPVANAPVFKGDGGRSFAVLIEGGKVYTAMTSNGVNNIYQVDIATATATKGAEIEGTFLGGIAKLK